MNLLERAAVIAGTSLAIGLGVATGVAYVIVAFGRAVGRRLDPEDCEVGAGT